MIISVASRNLVKVQAVREVVEEHYSNPVVGHFFVESNVSEQPMSINETFNGAVNRARNGHLKKQEGDYTVGIEDGLLKVGEREGRHLNVTACAVYDGSHIGFGMSCGFEFPPETIDYIFEHGVDASEALYQTGITPIERVGYDKGIIHMLTRGKMTRKDRIKQAVEMAFVPFENKKWYKS